MAMPFPGAYRPSINRSATTGPSADGVTDHAQREQLAVVGYLASSVAHEISSPLATILATTQSLLALLPPESALETGLPHTEALRRELGLIEAEAQRAGSLVGSLLALARHEQPERRLVRLTDVVRRTVTLVGRQLRAVDILLDAPAPGPTSPAPHGSCVWGDGNRVQQVLLNLIVNAQQAIRACRTAGRIRVGLEQRGEMVAIVVEDDGPGIPAAMRSKVFAPFFTTKRPGEGTGLGLSISADIVRQHGGLIQLDDSPLGGARFTLLFPPAPADAAPGSEPPGARGTPSGPARGRVLLVDDETALRVSFKRLLMRHGFDVTAEPSAEDALRELRSAPYDVVVSDLRMPGLSGEEFYDRLVAEFPRLQGRVVFSSGDLTRGETQAFLQRTGCPSLQKPYDVVTLTTLLDDLLKGERVPLSRVS
jgi:nitrogen-specific signal transduction histidine kinase/CheY-like chemotaxis protein